MPKSVPPAVRMQMEAESPALLQLTVWQLAFENVFGVPLLPLRTIVDRLDRGGIDVGDGKGMKLYQALSMGRSETKTQGGLEIGTMNVEVPNCTLTIYLGGDTTVDSTLGRLALDGWLDCAKLTFYWLDVSTYTAFQEGVWTVQGIVSVTPEKVTLRLEDALAAAMVCLPRCVVQEQCNNRLFDPVCGVVALSKRDSNAALGGSTTTMYISASQPDEYYTLGHVVFTDGQNQSVSRVVAKHYLGRVWFMSPFPYAVQPGDGYFIWPGCDKTYSTCKEKFLNENNYRGFPNVPRPEVMLP